MVTAQHHTYGGHPENIFMPVCLTSSPEHLATLKLGMALKDKLSTSSKTLCRNRAFQRFRFV